MKSKIVTIDDIKEASFNYNYHPVEQIEEIKKSLIEFGQYKNIVIWRGECIAGNGVLMAARDLGWSKVAVVDVSSLEMSVAKKLCVVDNVLNLSSIVNDDELQSIVDELGGEIPGLELGIDRLNIELDGDIDDIEEIDPGDINQECTIKVTCRDYDEYEEAIAIIGKKIDWEKLKGIIK